MLSLFLCVDHFDTVASSEQLEFLHSDLILSTEVPSDEILEFSFLKVEATSFDELSKFIDVDFLSVLMANSIEQSLKELIVLLLICELI